MIPVRTGTARIAILLRHRSRAGQRRRCGYPSVTGRCWLSSVRSTPRHLAGTAGHNPRLPLGFRCTLYRTHPGTAVRATRAPQDARGRAGRPGRGRVVHRRVRIRHRPDAVMDADPFECSPERVLRGRGGARPPAGRSLVPVGDRSWAGGARPRQCATRTVRRADEVRAGGCRCRDRVGAVRARAMVRDITRGAGRLRRVRVQSGRNLPNLDLGAVGRGVDGDAAGRGARHFADRLFHFNSTRPSLRAKRRVPARSARRCSRCSSRPG